MDGVRFILAHNPPKPEDFWNSKQRKAWKKDPECERVSLSVWADRSPLEALLELPNHRGKMVLAAGLSKEHGKMQQTPPAPHHYSVWFYEQWHGKLHTVFKP